MFGYGVFWLETTEVLLKVLVVKFNTRKQRNLYRILKNVDKNHNAEVWRTAAKKTSVKIPN